MCGIDLSTNNVYFLRGWKRNCGKEGENFLAEAFQLSCKCGKTIRWCRRRNRKKGNRGSDEGSQDGRPGPSGELSKTDELITEPITGSAETVVKAVEETAEIPVEAAKEEPAASQSK